MTQPPTAAELFGARVRELRKKRGLTQVDIAERLGIPQSRVSEIEGGTRAPTLVTLLRLSTALGCKPTALVAPFDKMDVAVLLRD